MNFIDSALPCMVGKFIGGNGCISKKLFVDRMQLITKLKSNMKGVLVSVVDKLLLRKKIIIGNLVFLSNNLLLLFRES